MALGDLHIFNGEEYVDTELAPLLNENFNSLKEYVDDASRWQVMPLQFEGTNVKYLIHEVTAIGNGTYLFPLIELNGASFSACSLRFFLTKSGGDKVFAVFDIDLQKVQGTQNCNINFKTTGGSTITVSPCTFTYNNVKYAGLQVVTDGADTIWATGYKTSEWVDPIVSTSVTDVSIAGSDMNFVPTLFKNLQTDKIPVSDYDVVNKGAVDDVIDDIGYWKPEEAVVVGDVRKLKGEEYAGCFLICRVAGTTGTETPTPDPEDGVGLGSSSGSLKLFTTLEEIGMAKGQESFASLHNSLLLNSEMTYYYTSSDGYNNSMYPASKGVLKVTKLSTTVSKFEFTSYEIEGTTNLAVLYTAYYDANNSTNTVEWTKTYTRLMKATQVQAEAGEDDTTFMTPLKTKQALDALVDGLPVGWVSYQLILFPKHVKLNGATVSRSDYPNLVTFATTNDLWTETPATEPWKFGVGDGSTTMVLPDLRNRASWGGDTPAILEAGLPNITGQFYACKGDQSGTNTTLGAFIYTGKQLSRGRDGNSFYGYEFKFDASRSNVIYGNSTTVQPPAMVLIPQIKYI